jgi:Flp pilus assembly protein TadG
MRFMRLRNFRRNDEGFSLVFVGVGMMALVGVSMLAIDVGQMMTARSQAQNSADAGALAGATALYYNSWTDRTPSGPAVTNALAASLANKVIGDNVSITPDDVDFPLSPTTGEANRVHVTVYRDAAHGNAVSTLIAHYFGISTVDIAATATAEVAPAGAMTCVLPFTIPDRWKEVRDPPFDQDDSFDMYASKNVLLPNPDVYIGPGKAGYTGYDAILDRGTRIQLKADNGSKIAPSFYYPYAIPVSTGASDYRESIGGCNTTRMEPNQLYDPEPGMMTGPTKQGMDDLIALDPDATWDPNNKRVISTKHPSPRVRAIPLFDPQYYADGKLNGRNASLKFVNYLGFFIDKMDGNDIYGYITPIGGLPGTTPGPPSSMFPAYIRLVQ